MLLPERRTLATQPPAHDGQGQDARQNGGSQHLQNHHVSALGSWENDAIVAKPGGYTSREAAG